MVYTEYDLICYVCIFSANIFHRDSVAARLSNIFSSPTTSQEIYHIHFNSQICFPFFYFLFKEQSLEIIRCSHQIKLPRFRLNGVRVS